MPWWRGSRSTGRRWWRVMSDEQVKLDFLGQKYGVGDTIVYAGTSGRSVQMVLGRVVKFNPTGSVKVQPIDQASRWKQHHGSSHFIDSRTGKRIDPYREDGGHIKVPSFYRHEETGEELSYSELGTRTRGNYLERAKFHYVSTVFQDWVVKVDEPVKSVTLHVTENILKVVLPEGPEDD